MGDSIIKNIDHIDGVDVKSFPGATLGKLAVLVSYSAVYLEKYDYIIIHVWTNDVDNFSKKKICTKIAYEGMISDFANLVAIVRKKKPGFTIIVYTILPRPVDHSATDDLIKKVNACLKDVMSTDLNLSASVHTKRLLSMVYTEGTFLPKRAKVCILIQKV